MSVADERRFPIATTEEAKSAAPHPRKAPATTVQGGSGGTYFRTKCGVCGETAFGSTPAKSQAALAESACLPAELRWNDWLQRRPM